MRFYTPRIGDFRNKTIFLWLPKKFDGCWIWLEKVTISQVYLRNGWRGSQLIDPKTGLLLEY